MSRYTWTTHPTSRVRFKATLRTESALHIGGGKQPTLSDAAVVRHADGRPFIPGSSLKGVLRSHLERLGQALDFVDACMLHSYGNLMHELSAVLPDSFDDVGQELVKLKGAIESNALSEVEDLTCITPVWTKSRADATVATAKHFQRLCHICTLFGSPILAGKIRIPDLEVDEVGYAGRIEVRDGVGIDRDRGVAANGVKYDFEVVPAGTRFNFLIDVDSPDEKELGLLSAGIREMQQGYLAIGGKTTRGLGAFKLVNLEVFETRFDMDNLKAYLLKREHMPLADAESFLDNHIEVLFAG